MTTELYWLTLTALMTALMWLPYILNRISVRGLFPAMGNPSSDDKPHADWAERAMRAHRNAVENLAIFGVLVLTANAAGVTGEATGLAALVYFFARLAHYVIYIAGVPVLRTLAFATGVACQLVFAFALL